MIFYLFLFLILIHQNHKKNILKKYNFKIFSIETHLKIKVTVFPYRLLQSSNNFVGLN
jgi:hypothetical protein